MAFNALRSIFSRTPVETNSDRRVTLVGPRIPRHSTGWASMLKHLKEEESLQVLDIGPTSASNVNLVTGLGHSLYMADLVIEAHREEWKERFAEDPLTAESFIDQNLNFKGRLFDVVLLWTTLDFIPETLIEPTVARLHGSLNPGGKILAFFHSKILEGESIFFRYHATASDSVEMQEAERFAMHQVFTTRKVEKLFSAYQGCKFFLAKDNLAEVIVNR